MSKAVFDLCYFDEVVFDYEVFLVFAAAQLDISTGKKSMLVFNLSSKADLVASIEKRVRMDNSVDTKIKMLVDSGRKSLLDIELLGGGS